MTRKRLALVVSVGIGSLLYGASPALAQPSLGNASSFAILGGQTVTAAGIGTVINGDVGVSPGTSITGFPAGATTVPPYSTHANDGAAIAAQTSVTALYTNLVNTGGATPLLAELGGTVRGPGVYSFAATANIASNQVLTLDGAGVYIFKVGSALTANTGSSVLLINGATPCNVFWQITDAATLNGVTFAGNVVAQGAITLGVGARLDGRALTTPPGAVTLAGGNSVGGCSSAAVPGCPTITLSPATLPNGQVGVAYSQTIVGSGGVAPYTFSVSSGSLPNGLTLTPAGVLAGTPATPSTSTFTIRGVDANGCVALRDYQIVIAPAAVPPPVCPTIVLPAAAPPSGTVGVAYSQTITASGGTAPYRFGVTAGAVPAGLTLTPDGLLAGTPTTAGTTTVTIRATDANGCFTERAYTIVIAAAPPPPPVCPPITISPATLPNARVGVAVSQTFTGSGGTGPYSFGVTSGALPAGVTLTPAGVLAGTPTTLGTSTFTIRGTDANGCFAERTFTVTIATAVPTLPQVFSILLALALAGMGYLRLRRRARVA